MSSTSTEHLRCFPLFCLYFCLQKPSPPYLLRLSCSSLPRLVPLPHPPSTHPTSHFPLTVFVSLIADERQKFVRAQDLYSAFMCRSTLHRWEPFKPKVIHACICMRKRGARRPRQDCSMLYMHTYFPPLVLFFDTCPRVWADRKKKKKVLTEDVRVKYGWSKGIIMNQYFTHIYSYVHTSKLTFLLLAF